MSVAQTSCRPNVCRPINRLSYDYYILHSGNPCQIRKTLYRRNLVLLLILEIYLYHFLRNYYFRKRKVCTTWSANLYSGYSWSFKVINFRPYQTPVCDFLLLSHSNRGPTSHRVRVMTAYWSKFRLSTEGYPIFDALVWGWTLESTIVNFGQKNRDHYIVLRKLYVRIVKGFDVWREYDRQTDRQTDVQKFDSNSYVIERTLKSYDTRGDRHMKW